MDKIQFYITIEDIRKYKPCYDPAEKLGDEWKGSLIDILTLTNVNVADKIWVIAKFLDDKTNRLFAVWCAREALKLIDNPDPRLINACNVAEKFALGKATKEELVAARFAAWDAEGYSVRDAARDAARDADATASVAASVAASVDAWDTSAAARYATRYAAWDSAGFAASAASTSDASAAQIKQLIKMIEGQNG